MHALWYMPLVTLYLSDIRLIVTHACETGAYADEYFVSVWTVAAKRSLYQETILPYGWSWEASGMSAK